MNQREIIDRNVERWTKTWRGQKILDQVSQAAFDLRQIHKVLSGRPPHRPYFIFEVVFGVQPRGRWDDWSGRPDSPSGRELRGRFEEWRRRNPVIWRNLVELRDVHRLITRGPESAEYTECEIETLCEYLNCTRDQLLDPNYQPPRGRR